MAANCCLLKLSGWVSRGTKIPGLKRAKCVVVALVCLCSEQSVVKELTSPGLRTAPRDTTSAREETPGAAERLHLLLVPVFPSGPLLQIGEVAIFLGGVSKVRHYICSCLVLVPSVAQILCALVVNLRPCNPMFSWEVSLRLDK